MDKNKFHSRNQRRKLGLNYKMYSDQASLRTAHYLIFPSTIKTSKNNYGNFQF